MTADRNELHELIDELPDDQVSALLADARSRIEPEDYPGDRAFAWVGVDTTKNGETDVAANFDEYLEGFGADSR